MVQFPWSCEVCAKMLRNRRALAGHLRHNQDALHLKLGQRWRSSYHRTKRCLKCGQTWEVTEKAERDKKRCPACQAQRQLLGKRAYEREPTRATPTLPKLPTKVTWLPGDSLHTEVLQGLTRGERVNALKSRLGISYKVLRQIGEQALGAEGYKALARTRKRLTGGVNLLRAHENYRALSAKQKAQRLKKRFGRGSALERSFAEQLRRQGLTDLKLNSWQSVPIDGRRVPREADIKLSLTDGRKVVVLCDGEAFHGPGTIFGDPQDRIHLDRQTALGFFALGYSVVRYAESEIHDGSALAHLAQMILRLQTCRRIYRNWCPVEEVEV